MQIPVYDSVNGQPRRVSVNQLIECIQGNLTSDASAPFRLYAGTVAELNANYPAASYTGAIVYCTNGNGGTACLAVSNGTSWLRVALGAAIST